MKTFFFTFAFCALLLFSNSHAQDKLYSNEFPLSDVTLLDGPFKNARDLNIQYLLQHDADRCLAPYLKIAGLTPKASNYPNWESIGLDGHIGGHYLSAMAMNYAATGNSECKDRMKYMISELKACQDANSANNSDWGINYVGGVPNSSDVWSKLKTGDFSSYRSHWAPWYNLHKMYAGLRDAWMYGGNEEAKTIFLKFCDWGIDITSGLTDDQMESMLGTEHGGMNEIFADAYQMTGDDKYLTAAKRFSHKDILDPMAAGNDNLDNKHANTQIPKAVGFQRIAELCDDDTYLNAASFFWETVALNRSLAFGGNSRKEHFPSASACDDYINEIDGPETCNTYNMLRLTEVLFRANPLAQYADFYERALYNHILSTQHPEHGGYVYHTPARPRHYRVYSAPNLSMWCCVGTGMENHGKYNQFIYTHQNDSLFLNLFIASELDWKAKGIKIKQETNFPFEERTKLTVTEGSAQFQLMIRYPSWVAAEALKVIVNGDTLPYSAEPSCYIPIDRSWTAGDEIEILLPMHNSIEELINVPEYVAFMHGPIMLGAKTGTEYLTGLIADDGPAGQHPNGPIYPVDKAPIIVEDDRSKIPAKLVPVEDKRMTFTAPELNIVNSQNNLVFEPFYNIHDSRYMIYWHTLTNSQYQAYLDSLAEIDDLSDRTIDFVATGEQQSELAHAMQDSNSNTGTHMGEIWRDARDGGYFSYNLKTNSETNLYLMVRYWGNESGNRTFDILIDDAKLRTVNISGVWNVMDFKNTEYRIPNSTIEGKDTISAKFQAPSNGYAGGVFYIRLLRKEGATGIKQGMNQPQLFKLYQNYPNPFNPSTLISYQLPANAFVTLKVYDILGKEVKTLINEKQDTGSHSVQFNASNFANGVYFYRLKTETYQDTKKLLLLK
ncbi:MAG: glycoside hydrolase family 127 protein [Calditrichaceae bacterium]|nr:glycoside hydrolase family 127 protein [Calditrichaceae bacterium]